MAGPKFKMECPTGRPWETKVSLDDVDLEGMLQSVDIHVSFDKGLVVTLACSVGSLEVDAAGKVLVNRVEVPDHLAEQVYLKLKERFEGGAKDESEAA